MLKPKPDARQMGRWAAIATCVLGLGACASASATEAPVALPAGSVEEFPVAGGLYGATELAVDPEGDVWLNEAGPGKIDRISPRGVITGEFSLLFGSGFQPYWPESSEPSALVLGLGGDMWFTERGANDEGRSFVDAISPTGQISEIKIPSPGSIPAGIALGPDGNMWFTEEGSGEIGRVSGSEDVTEFMIPPTGSQETMSPRAIAVGGDGNLWFTDRGLSDEGQNLIGRITPEGSVKEFSIPAPYDDPDALALGADGNIWFTESPDAIGRITPAGIFTEFTVPSVSGSSSGLAEGPDGNMWFTENANAIGRITPQGVVTSFEGISAGNSLPGSLVQGREGELWYVDGDEVDRLRTPLAPVNTAAPAVSGEVVEGKSLSVSEGSWSHAPSVFSYQWQICNGSGSSCADLSGANESTVTLVSGEVGHTLRAVITASNVGGAAAAVSSASAVVQEAAHIPVSVPVPKVVNVGEPLPVVGSAMTWSFGWTRKYTIVEALVVHGVPDGGVVQLTCHGHGCPFTRWLSNAVSRRACKHRKCKPATPTVLHGQASVAKLFDGHHLGVGARVVVEVLKAGWVGKSFVFTMRADKSPGVQITCLGSGPSNPTGGC
jgi:streptogramin lyase